MPQITLPDHMQREVVIKTTDRTIHLRLMSRVDVSDQPIPIHRECFVFVWHLNLFAHSLYERNVGHEV